MLLERARSRSLILCTLGAAAALSALAALAACSSDNETAPAVNHERDGTAVTIGNGTAYAG